MSDACLAYTRAYGMLILGIMLQEGTINTYIQLAEALFPSATAQHTVQYRIEHFDPMHGTRVISPCQHMYRQYHSTGDCKVDVSTSLHRNCISPAMPLSLCFFGRLRLGEASFLGPP